MPRHPVILVDTRVPKDVIRDSGKEFQVAKLTYLGPCNVVSITELREAKLAWSVLVMEHKTSNQGDRKHEGSSWATAR